MAGEVLGVVGKLMQGFFLVMCFASVGVGVYYTYVVSEEVARRASQYLLAPLSTRFLSAHKQEAKHISKFCDSAFQLVYFAITAPLLWNMLINMPESDNYLPPALGGSGVTANAWTHLPLHYAISPAFKTFYLVSLGFHIQSIVYHVLFQDSRSDFVEMLAHHLVTIFLIAGSFVGNLTRIGLLVILVHDFPDIFVFAAKLGANTPSTTFTLSAYVAMLASWGYMRLYVYPFVVIVSSVTESVDVSTVERVVLNGLLMFLQILHVYWYALFLEMGYHFLSTGETVDKQSLEADDDNDASKAKAE
ncbi:LAG1 longevity assurance [Thecamonas trahens ATCC 50062]|uniref:LAG1 longevity assurance n=1 Tax=Thecamonas trahens ATCC 50062 TaxID=461836 RepID=A0A0L0DJR7_THETB|nr:LAG1 longevity assurance [Thecamonas trahens ATCC 50062]KNC52649.1 LAG1 longevity assurance [Thecamonas trahens ATCC 50062]|eukprot:XP_013755200.1 LAG1 longevity assurance [Thecamonas trahens ATCC 50062]